MIDPLESKSFAGHLLDRFLDTNFRKFSFIFVPTISLRAAIFLKECTWNLCFHRFQSFSRVPAAGTLLFPQFIQILLPTRSILCFQKRKIANQNLRNDVLITVKPSCSLFVKVRDQSIIFLELQLELRVSWHQDLVF